MKDKVIVITGASKGLGESLARLLAQLGAKLVISARDAEALKKISEDIGSVFVVADVSDEKAVEKIAAEAISKFGRIDIWINNAGVWLPRASVEETDMKRSHDMLEVNLFGTVYGSKSALIQMKKQGYGSIVNIVSTSALTGRPLSAMYSASKHAARGFTDSLREEAKGTGISVIGIYPGGIKTHLFDEKKPEDFNDFMTPEYVAQKIIDNLLKEIPDAEQILKRPGQR